MIEKYDRVAVFVELRDYCHLSKPHDFLEVTAWKNGEGFDLAINDHQTQMTWGTFKALKKAIRVLED